jgi:hypothetical protein
MAELRETRAKAAGTVKKIVAALKGEPSIVQRLKEEHGEVLSLMRQVAGSGNDGVEIRERLFVKIKERLLAHAHAEENEFYSVLIGFEDTRPLANHSIEEHAAMEQLVRSLETMDRRTASWLAVFEQLLLRVEHHIEEEERTLFPLVQKHLDRKNADAMDKRYIVEHERQLHIVLEEGREPDGHGEGPLSDERSG